MILLDDYPWEGKTSREKFEHSQGEQILSRKSQNPRERDFIRS